MFFKNLYNVPLFASEYTLDDYCRVDSTVKDEDNN